MPGCWGDAAGSSAAQPAPAVRLRRCACTSRWRRSTTRTARAGWHTWRRPTGLPTTRSSSASTRVRCAGPWRCPWRSLRRASTRPRWSLLVDEQPFVCPLDDRLRVWAAVESFADDVPEPLLSAFLPGQAAGRALADFAGWRRREQPAAADPDGDLARPGRVVHDLHRRRARGRQRRRRGDGPVPTTMGQTRRRVARALDVVRRSLGEGPVSGEVEDLARWLEEFHAALARRARLRRAGPAARQGRRRQGHLGPGRRRRPDGAAHRRRGGSRCGVRAPH